MVFLRPEPATRTQTFACFFEMSSPAHRTCTTSIAATHFPSTNHRRRPSRAGRNQSLTQGSKAPIHGSRGALRHHADLQTHGTTEQSGSTTTNPTSLAPRELADHSRTRRPQIFAHHGEPEAPRC